MPDEPLARIDERLKAVTQRLGRAETICEQRSGRHVDRDLYTSERQADREAISDIGRRLGSHERGTDLRFDNVRREVDELRAEMVQAVKAVRDEQSSLRRFIVTTGVAIVAVVAGVFLAVML